MPPPQATGAAPAGTVLNLAHVPRKFAAPHQQQQQQETQRNNNNININSFSKTKSDCYRHRTMKPWRVVWRRCRASYWNRATRITLFVKYNLRISRSPAPHFARDEYDHDNQKAEETNIDGDGGVSATMLSRLTAIQRWTHCSATTAAAAVWL